MPTTPTPPAPSDWNRTIEDLFDEVKRGLRSSVGFPETEWAREYALSLMPADTRFPKHAEVYVATEAVQVSLMLSWSSPVTTDAPYLLPAGTKVKIESAASDRPLVVYTVPVEYKAVEKLALSFWTRIRPDYRGYCIPLNTRDLLGSFSLMPSPD